MNIIIACGGTGGHLFPGIAVAQQLRKLGHHPVLLISRKEVDAEASRKYGDLDFHTIQAIAKPPLLSLKTPLFLWNLARTYLSCARILKQERADAVVGMGGFTSMPPVRAAKSLGLRTFVHDSNALPGKSNRLTARWCTKVLLGMAEAAAYFPGSTCEVVGTPVREELYHLPGREEARTRLGLPADKPLILVTGGSQGARNLNSLLVEAAKDDPDVHYLVIAGRLDHDRVQELAAGAPNITVTGFCSDMPAAYAAADGVIARSGASTLTELSVIGKACLLVPFPFAADDHQTHNARVFTGHGAATMCQQADLTGDTVRKFVHDTVLNAEKRTAMEDAMRALARPNAAEAIARAITQA
ncbi:MAG: undecaprenyldiphospho-muramoylpentapeptide beta-N-acetylglucosaminyltransferase [Akkermansia sp.]|nr:undecaprenyldiphospho-muramoylpentapeptide beta-N-acetylglucosaminyltransferase [Akkermansia sp.]